MTLEWYASNFNDPDLIPGNIKDWEDIFGVAGNYVGWWAVTNAYDIFCDSQYCGNSHTWQLHTCMVAETPTHYYFCSNLSSHYWGSNPWTIFVTKIEKSTGILTVVTQLQNSVTFVAFDIISIYLDWTTLHINTNGTQRFDFDLVWETLTEIAWNNTTWSSVWTATISYQWKTMSASGKVLAGSTDDQIVSTIHCV